MKKETVNFLCLVFAFSALLFSCSKKNSGEPSDPNDGGKKMTMLVYAIASNLDLNTDKSEMLKGAKDIDLDKNRLLLYEVYTTGMPRMLQIVKGNNGPEWKTLKTYDRDLYSTDPKRISKVIEDARSLAPADRYGLVFWSHGSGWTPDFSNHGDNATKSTVPPVLYSFGADKDTSRNPYYTDKTDIDELAEAIPSGVFDYIWFDVCYMSGIETIYQFRNKCRWFVGSPAEIPGNGMPYDRTLPLLLTSNYDCKKAAEKFFSYYRDGEDSDWDVAFIAVFDTDKIEYVADCCKAMYNSQTVPSAVGLQKYSRGGYGPFYDFGQYSVMKASKDPVSVDAFMKSLDRMTVYKAATAKDFDGRTVNQENYSGISCELFNPAEKDKATEYYKTLDWYKRVY